MTADLHALTGAYTLHAIAPPERMTFERHLAVCESCTHEVAELRETATRLGLAATRTPPPHLRVAVLDRVREVRQGAIPLRRKPVTVRLSSIAAAVLLVVAAALGVIAVQQRQSITDSSNQASAVAGVMHAPDGEVSHHDGLTVATSRSMNRAVLWADTLPSPPSGHVYQAWTVAADYHSAGLLNADKPLTIADLDDATHVAITIEPEGGSAHPTGKPIRTVAV